MDVGCWRVGGSRASGGVGRWISGCVLRAEMWKPGSVDIGCERVRVCLACEWVCGWMQKRLESGH